MSIIQMVQCDNPACKDGEPKPLVSVGELRYRVVIETLDKPIPWPSGKPSIELDFCSWVCLLAYVNEL